MTRRAAQEGTISTTITRNYDEMNYTSSSYFPNTSVFFHLCLSLITNCVVTAAAHRRSSSCCSFSSQHITPRPSCLPTGRYRDILGSSLCHSRHGNPIERVRWEIAARRRAWVSSTRRVRRRRSRPTSSVPRGCDRVGRVPSKRSRKSRTRRWGLFWVGAKICEEKIVSEMEDPPQQLKISTSAIVVSPRAAFLLHDQNQGTNQSCCPGGSGRVLFVEVVSVLWVPPAASSVLVVEPAA